MLSKTKSLPDRWQAARYISGKKKISLLLIVALLLSFGIAYGQHPWPMFQHDRSHTGRSPYVGPATSDILWDYPVGAAVRGISIASDGTLYFADGRIDYKLYAINSDGTLNWVYPLGDEVYNATPAIASDGTIYIGCDNCYIYAINPDGTPKWQLDPGDWSWFGMSSPVLSHDESTLYIGGDMAIFYAINCVTHTVDWRFYGDFIFFTSPVIGSDGTIYTTCWDNKLYAINPDGSQKWSYSCNGWLGSPAIGSDGTIYFGRTGGNGPLYAIEDSVTYGHLKWTYGNQRVGASPAIGSDGTIYANCPGALKAINPDGTLQWSYPTISGNTDYISPTVGGDGTIYTGADDGDVGKLYAVYPDGTLKWTYDIPSGEGGFGNCAPVIGSDGTLYFGSGSGSMSNVYNGHLRAIAPVISAFDISGNIGYFSDDAPVPNADVDLTGDDTYSTTTTTGGDYLFNDIPGGNYVSTPSKADDLGGLSGLDASRIARFSAGLYSLDCLEMIAGDVSMNGEISGLDASRVARYAVGSITELNDDGIEWVFTPEPIPDCTDWPPIVYENTREYSPLNSDLTDEDFIGIRLGDVSGNWSPEVRELLTYESFEITNIETDINSTLRIPVVIDNVTAIEGIDIGIAFDKEVLHLSGLTLNGGILAENDYAVESNLKEGKIVIYAQKELVSGAGVFSFMYFDVIGEVGSSSEIYLTRFDVNETEASGGFNVLDSENETVTRRLQINVGQTLLEKFALYPNNPNPFSSRTLIQYDLPKDTHVNIQVYNVKGQIVEELVNGVETAGRKQIEWNAKDRNSGIYFYRLLTEDKTIIKKMVLMR